MVSTRKKRQSNKRFLSQLGDFDQDMIIGNTVSEKQENTMVDEGTNDRDFTVGASNNNSAIDENAMNVKALKRCFNEKIDKEVNIIVDTVEDRIQNANLTAIDKFFAPKIELAIRSINASSGQDVTSVAANSERGEHVGIDTSFENASGNNNVSSGNDETRNSIMDEVSNWLVPEKHFDRQTHTYHSQSSQEFNPDLNLQQRNFHPAEDKIDYFVSYRTNKYSRGGKSFFQHCLRITNKIALKKH